MGNVLKFFLNAVKAIVLSPFYIVYFALYFIYAILNYLIGEIRLVFSGFRYGDKKENKYLKKVEKIINSSTNQNGGEAL
ncbi:MAG: hypothetical protein MR270_00095 [Erysipelotrichaceae bacterium]|nr:hypothetical protein [Erysipelotrichaceae bacterium]